MPESLILEQPLLVILFVPEHLNETSWDASCQVLEETFVHARSCRVVRRGNDFVVEFDVRHVHVGVIEFNIS